MLIIKSYKRKPIKCYICKQNSVLMIKSKEKC